MPTCSTIVALPPLTVSDYKRETRVRTRTNIISRTFLRRPRRYNVRPPLSLSDTHTTIVFAVGGTTIQRNKPCSGFVYGFHSL